MSEEKFLKNLKELPGFYRCYLAIIRGNIAAAAYIVRISEEVNYVLYWGDALEFRQVSPVASLLNSLVPVSADMGCSILDLGISSNGGELDAGLARFKLNLGALETIKPVFLWRNDAPEQ
jgi:hypothetical protein